MFTRLRSRALARVVLPALAAAACTAQPVLRPTGTQKFPPYLSNCKFQLRATHPGPRYVEVAQISIEGKRLDPAVYRSARKFADTVQAEICATGGDALVTEDNGKGEIVSGIVCHQIDQPEPGPVPAAALPTSASGPPAAWSGTCEPICSPGFACDNGVCIPQCNPACIDGETCGRDRLCHPKS